MLAKQIGPHGFFAAVSVSYDDTVGGVAVELAESARQISFGAAALQGVRYALAHCSPAVGSSVGRITVTTIEDLPVDTTPPAVAFAACYAAWSALDRKPTSEPRFDGLQIIFAD